MKKPVSPTGRIVDEIHNPSHGQGDPRRSREREDLRRAFDQPEPGRLMLDADYVALERQIAAALTAAALSDVVARDRLRLAEIEYLVATGWVMKRADAWQEPEGRRNRTLTHGHAVNSQKALDEGRLRFRAPRDHCTRCQQHYDNCACDGPNEEP